MNREIKFRAYDKHTKIMLPVVDIIKFTKSESINIIRDGVYGVGVTIPYQPQIELMQYTGLHDKNGKEIYEGDIVKYKVKGSNLTSKTVMEYNEEHGAFLFGIYNGCKMPCGKKTRMNKYTRKSVNDVEVIRKYL